MIDELINAFDERFHVREGTAADCLLRDDPEPAFDQVEPRGIGRREVQVKSWPASQPSLDLGVFVGGVVVDNQVHVELLGDFPVDVTEESEELLMATSSAANRVVVP